MLRYAFLTANCVFSHHIRYNLQYNDKSNTLKYDTDILFPTDKERIFKKRKMKTMRDSVNQM
uniref:Uncharacterized protein n=1 Tax=Anguilla anguilla TaxID=7936 RepID=A0A0E9X5D5_ANGAN